MHTLYTTLLHKLPRSSCLSIRSAVPLTVRAHEEFTDAGATLCLLSREQPSSTTLSHAAGLVGVEEKGGHVTVSALTRSHGHGLLLLVPARQSLIIEERLLPSDTTHRHPAPHFSLENLHGAVHVATERAHVFLGKMNCERLDVQSRSGSCYARSIVGSASLWARSIECGKVQADKARLIASSHVRARALYGASTVMAETVDVGLAQGTMSVLARRVLLGIVNGDVEVSGQRVKVRHLSQGKADLSGVKSVSVGVSDRSLFTLKEGESGRSTTAVGPNVSIQSQLLSPRNHSHLSLDTCSWLQATQEMAQHFHSDLPAPSLVWEPEARTAQHHDDPSEYPQTEEEE